MNEERVRCATNLICVVMSILYDRVLETLIFQNWTLIVDSSVNFLLLASYQATSQSVYTAPHWMLVTQLEMMKIMTSSHISQVRFRLSYSYQHLAARNSPNVIAGYYTVPDYIAGDVEATPDQYLRFFLSEILYSLPNQAHASAVNPPALAIARSTHPDAIADGK
jgi:hypothetical protein